MQVTTSFNRLYVILGAVLIQLSLGAIYAWSVFTPALIAAGWTKLETQLVFSVGLVTFALVMVVAGRALEKWGPRKLALAGGLLLGGGYALTGVLGATEFWTVLLGIGVIGGAGIGLGYVVPIAVGMRWFPDRKGLITGLAVAGFGFGAMGWVKMAGAWGQLIETAGLAQTFVLYGVAFAALIGLGSWWMRMPPKGWKPAGFVAPAATGGNGGQEFTAREMLRTPQFYLVFLTFAASAGAGLMSIGLMKIYPMESLQAAGYSVIEASAIAGTAMAVFFSLANGIGRIAWGMLSDHLGRKRSILVMTFTQALVLLLFTRMAGSEYLLYLGAALIGFNFGGNFALFPTFTADIFGNKRVGQNYPLVFLSYGVGGVAGPVLGGMLGDMGNFPLAFTVCGAACLGGALCTLLVATPDKNEANHPLSVHGFLHQLHLDHVEDVVEFALHPEHFRRASSVRSANDERHHAA
ncbi:OFA family MFS transporter [Magnetospira thiophila]